MQLPVSLQTEDLLRFIADLQAGDWKLLPAMANFNGREPPLRTGDPLLLLGAFAILTGQEDAFDVYGADSDPLNMCAALYHRSYSPAGVTDVDQRWSMQPHVRASVLEVVRGQLPKGVHLCRDAEMLQYLLTGGYYQIAQRAMDMLFL